jgi:hypothetical protein
MITVRMIGARKMVNAWLHRNPRDGPYKHKPQSEFAMDVPILKYLYIYSDILGTHFTSDFSFSLGSGDPLYTFEPWLPKCYADVGFVALAVGQSHQYARQ